MSQSSSPFFQFHAQILDYAGLYPPASLPLNEAFQNFIAYQSAPEAWMLSRFIIPARRLSELSELAIPFPADTVLSFSALGRSGTDSSNFLINLAQDIQDIQAFRTQHADRVIVDMFETTLSATGLNDASAERLINQTITLLQESNLMPFLEAPFNEHWQILAKTLIKYISRNQQPVGFKLRTGGVEANVFPSPEQVAWAIATARDAGIPIKATAGLHHPIRHYNESVQTKMHGFLNVFGAGILAYSQDLNQTQIQAIIEDEDPSHFIFNQQGFAWKKLSANPEQIEQARQHGVISFGSCSFDEPREDLQALGLLIK